MEQVIEVNDQHAGESVAAEEKIRELSLEMLPMVGGGVLDAKLHRPAGGGL